MLTSFMQLIMLLFIKVENIFFYYVIDLKVATKLLYIDAGNYNHSYFVYGPVDD